LSEIDISQEKADINLQIDGAQDRIADLENQLHLIDTELENLFQSRQQYILLSEISDRMDKLNKLGGARLFWGEACDEAQASANYTRVNNLVINYDEQVREVTKKRELIKEDIQSVIAQINILNDEILVVYELAEERDHEFVIEREMTVHPFRPMVMPWAMQGEDENRYRRILLLALLFSLVLGYLLPLWDLPMQTQEELTKVPEYLTKLIEKKQPPPPPPEVKPEPKKKDEKDKKPEDKKKKKKLDKKLKKKGKVVEKIGILAFKDNFSDLMDNTAKKKLGSRARLGNKGQKARKTTRSLVTSQAAGSSGGIQTSNLSRNVGGTGKSISGVAFSRVESEIGSEFFGEERPLSGGPGPSRTDEEIQIVFDRYKSALYRIYNRELRKNPTLQGKLVLKLTIEPSGKVSACSMESSDMDASALEKKIVARVKKFNFGPKDGVPALTILYPIDFLPAN